MAPSAPLRKETDLAFAPLQFLRDVRVEAGRVTWPSGRETLITTVMVLVMAVLIAVFFLLVDQVIGFGVRALFATAG
jgi:preprotein translocase subunit SecE